MVAVESGRFAKRTADDRIDVMYSTLFGIDPDEKVCRECDDRKVPMIHLARK